MVAVDVAKVAVEFRPIPGREIPVELALIFGRVSDVGMSVLLSGVVIKGAAVVELSACTVLVVLRRLAMVVFEVSSASLLYGIVELAPVEASIEIQPGSHKAPEHRQWPGRPTLTVAVCSGASGHRTPSQIAVTVGSRVGQLSEKPLVFDPQLRVDSAAAVALVVAKRAAAVGSTYPGHPGTVVFGGARPPPQSRYA